MPVGGDSDEVPLVGDGVPVAEGGDETELLRQTLVEDPPRIIQGHLNLQLSYMYLYYGNIIKYL